MIRIGALIALQIGDIVTTRLGLASGLVERNPIMALIVNDLWLFVLAKAVMVFLLVLMVTRVAMSERQRTGLWMLLFLIAAVPVVNNIVVSFG